LPYDSRCVIKQQKTRHAKRNGPINHAWHGLGLEAVFLTLALTLLALIVNTPAVAENILRNTLWQRMQQPMCRNVTGDLGLASSQVYMHSMWLSPNYSGLLFNFFTTLEMFFAG